MHKWKIEIMFKSGKELTVYYKGDETSSGEVAKKVLTGNSGTLNGFSDKDNTKNIFVKIDEIEAASISVA